MCPVCPVCVLSVVEIHVCPVCVCPGSPRCLFTGIQSVQRQVPWSGALALTA